MSDDKRTFRDKIDAIKHAIDPELLLSSLGFDVKHGSRELRGPCKVHGGDNKTAFRYNVDRDTWVCFTHKCHESNGNDIIGLVRGVNGCSFVEAIEYLETFVSGDLESLYSQYKSKKEKEDFLSLYRCKNNAVLLEEELKCYDGLRSDKFRNLGFTDETLDFFEISGGYTDKHGNLRDIIPIRDINSKLVAASYSIVDDSIGTDFKYLLSKHFNKDTVIYNLCNAKEYLNEKPLIIVEGFKSVWRLHDLGIYNVAAIMGSSITSGQASLLYKHAHSGIVLFLDADEAGIRGTEKAIDDLNNRLKIYAVFMTEYEKDPADIEKDRLIEYLTGYY